jgi:bifunctional UDP-N-acetylglucosamine pyrophosphorylase/glucosamine-1-phosphate N-acetyltransferase
MKPDDILGIVLAAGSSSRMWPVRDKHALRFAGRTLVDLHLERLRRAGLQRFVIVASDDNAAMLREQSGVDTSVVVQTGPSGMAGGVLSAMAQLGENELARPVYVTQPHDVVDASFHERVLDAAGNGSSDGYLAAYATKQYFPGGYLTLDGDRVAGIVEKPAPGSEPSDLVTIVAHLFADARPLFRQLTLELQQSESDDAYERAIASLLREHRFAPVRYDGAWQPLKYPWHVLEVMALLLDQLRNGSAAPGAGYTQVEPGVFFGEDVRVYPGGHVAAPAVVGHRAVIGNSALVRASVIGDGSVVGFGSEVARSYLGEGCQLHHNYIGDSVLERDVLLGFGSITANFRLDQRNVKSTVRGERIDSGKDKLGMIAGAGVKIGVGANIMPGVKIGAGAVVGPGQNVFRDVADGESLLPERGR